MVMSIVDTSIHTFSFDGYISRKKDCKDNLRQVRRIIVIFMANSTSRLFHNFNTDRGQGENDFIHI